MAHIDVYVLTLGDVSNWAPPPPQCDPARINASDPRINASDPRINATLYTSMRVPSGLINNESLENRPRPRQQKFSAGDVVLCGEKIDLTAIE